MTPDESRDLYQLGIALEDYRRSERQNDAAAAMGFVFLIVLLLLPIWLLYKALDGNSQTHPFLRFLAGFFGLILCSILGIFFFAIITANSDRNPTTSGSSNTQTSINVNPGPAFPVGKKVNRVIALHNQPPKAPPVFPGLSAEQLPGLVFNDQGEPVIPNSLLSGTRYLTPGGSRLGLDGQGVLTHLPKLPKGADSLDDPLARLLVDDPQQYWFFYFEYWRLRDIYSYLQHHQLDPKSMLDQKDRLTWLDLSGPAFTTDQGVSIFWAPMPN